MDPDATDDPPKSQPDPDAVPSTERCVYVPDGQRGSWHAERLPLRAVVIAEPVDGPPDSGVERTGG
jgi:hypothetical protein